MQWTAWAVDEQGGGSFKTKGEGEGGGEYGQAHSPYWSSISPRASISFVLMNEQKLSQSEM